MRDGQMDGWHVSFWPIERVMREMDAVPRGERHWWAFADVLIDSWFFRICPHRADWFSQRALKKCLTVFRTFSRHTSTGQTRFVFFSELRGRCAGYWLYYAISDRHRSRDGVRLGDFSDADHPHKFGPVTVPVSFLDPGI